MTMIASAKAPIVVVGAGYVGLVTAVGFAKVRQVRLVDIDATLIDELKAGATPIYEAGLKSRLDAVRDKNLTFHTNLEDVLDEGLARLVFVAVGTPPSDPPIDPDACSPDDPDGNLPADPDGDDVGKPANLGAVNNIIDVLMQHRELALVMKSTVPPETGRAVLERARESNSDLVYLSCPEFLQEGEAFEGFDSPDRIVVGREEQSDEQSWAADELRELHAELHPGLRSKRSYPPYLEMSLTSAEILKHTSNLFLAARISCANQIANLCEELDANVMHVMEGVGADSRIGPGFLKAGIGYGGSCFGKDVRALHFVAKDANVDLSFVNTVLSVNENQPIRVVQKLERRFETLESVRVAILGLAFKPGTGDLRGSPAFALAHHLRVSGATLRAWDPEPSACERAEENWSLSTTSEWTPLDEQIAMSAPIEGLPQAEIATSAIRAMTGAHAVVLVTAWPQFRDIDWCEAASVMAGTLVVDGRNQLSADAVRAAGLEYDGTGCESRGLHRPLLEGAAEV